MWWRRARPAVARAERVCRRARFRSDVAQHNLAGTPPANRQEIAYAAADHEPCRAALMTQEAIGVENRGRKQAISILAGDDLTSVQVSGQDQVIAPITERFPDSWVMSA